MKLTFNIDQSSVDVVFNGIKSDLQKVITKTIEHLGANMVKSAQDTTKFNHGNHFNEGITFELLNPNIGQVKSEVYNDKGTEYSNFLEYGNTAVDGKKMTFQIDGQWITTYHRKAISEQHLGFFTDAVGKTTEQVSDTFDEEFNKLFK